jgi:hypothetical protein
MATNHDATPMEVKDDEASINTLPGANLLGLRNSEAKNYCVKFTYRPTTSKTTQQVLTTHYAILKKIYENFPEAKIYDEKNKQMKSFEAKSVTEFMRMIDFVYIPPNPNKKRKEAYITHHQIISTVPISEIKRHHDIEQRLNKVKGAMKIHHWRKDQTKIANLGFFVSTDPSNYLATNWEKVVRDRIAKAHPNISEKKIPYFKCIFSSPFDIHQNTSVKISTKAYDLQCESKDAKVLIDLVKVTYKSDPIFIFHKMRHTHNKEYRRAILFQNQFLADNRIVPITGVSMDMMFYAREKLIWARDPLAEETDGAETNVGIEGVLQILEHKATNTEGRWSVVTTKKYFTFVKEYLDAHLAQIVEDIIRFHNCEQIHKKVGLGFKNPNREEDDASSDGTMDSYLSVCSTIYGNEEEDECNEEFQQPPQQRSPAPQAWGTGAIPESVMQSSASQSVSGVSNEEFETLRAENNRLAKQVEQAQAQIQELMKCNVLTSATTIASTPAPANVIQGLDLERIISEAATRAAAIAAQAAVENYIHQMQHQSATDYAMTATIGNAGITDMSFGDGSTELNE